MDPLHVSSGEAELFVARRGRPDAPAVVLVHGYPDTHGVWEETADLLAARFHVVAYDVRGMGASKLAPTATGAFAIEHLVGDLAAVVDAVTPEGRVHLVGHDWGAFQCWEALVDPRLAGRIASFTAIAGPRIDGAMRSLGRALRESPGRLPRLADQARRSWYVAAFQLPALPERLLGLTAERGWRATVRRRGGIEPRSGHPAATLSSDAARGVEIYRANIGRLVSRRDPVAVDVPVQIIVPTRDPHISSVLYEDAEGWARRLWRRDIRAGHWVQRSHPTQVARWIGELVDHLEAGGESASLRRARGRVVGNPFRGRLALVTGAGSGIGRATTLALAREGVQVIAADIDEAAARDTAAQRPDRVHSVGVNVADGAAMTALSERVETEWGVPEIVVNNAGIGVGGPLLETPEHEWERLIAVNLWGVIHGTQLFARLMVDAGVEGHIVNLASGAAFAPSRALPAYSTIKAGVLMLSECARAELAGAGIGVSAICPGIINTNIVRTASILAATPEQEQRSRERAVRLYTRRNYGPERVAEAILEAIRRNRAVVPVTPEAHAARALSRLSPALTRALARIPPQV